MTNVRIGGLQGILVRIHYKVANVLGLLLFLNIKNVNVRFKLGTDFKLEKVEYNDCSILPITAVTRFLIEIGKADHHPDGQDVCKFLTFEWNTVLNPQFLSVQ